MDDNHSQSEEDEERPRPRVVDKRVTARAAPAEATPGDKAPAQPAPEPPVEQPTPSATPPPERIGEPPGPDAEQVWTPEREAEARQIAEEIGRVPATDWVLSTVMTLVNVASVKLEQGDSEGSQIAIDALAGIVDAVGSRLGANEGPLRQVLAQLRMAYAEAVMPDAGTEG